MAESEPHTEREGAHGRQRGVTVGICLFLGVLIFAIDSLTPLGIAGGVPYVAVILVALRSESKSLPVISAVVVSFLVVIGVFTSPRGGEAPVIFVNRMLALFAVWTTAILGVQRKTLFEAKERAEEKVKILSGLLPICASCKKIRDEQGAWRQMEVYIRDHSEADFSHGICPDCARKLYPDIDLSPGNRS